MKKVRKYGKKLYLFNDRRMQHKSCVIQSTSQSSPNFSFVFFHSNSQIEEFFSLGVFITFILGNVYSVNMICLFVIFKTKKISQLSHLLNTESRQQSVWWGWSQQRFHRCCWWSNTLNSTFHLKNKSKQRRWRQRKNLIYCIYSLSFHYYYYFKTKLKTQRYETK